MFQRSLLFLMIKLIPFISFSERFEWMAIPPFGGAVTRFIVKKKNQEKKISVYLDCYDVLGCVGKPYWEAYPIEEDTFRCGINEIDELKKAIMEELEKK